MIEWGCLDDVVQFSCQETVGQLLRQDTAACYAVLPMVKTLLSRMDNCGICPFPGLPMGVYSYNL